MNGRHYLSGVRDLCVAVGVRGGLSDAPLCHGYDLAEDIENPPES